MPNNNPTGINQYTGRGGKATYGTKKPLTKKSFPYGSKRNPAGRKSPSGAVYGNRPSTQLARARVAARVRGK